MEKCAIVISLLRKERKQNEKETFDCRYGDWEETDGKIELTIDGEAVEATVEGEELTMQIDAGGQSVGIVFEKG